VYLLSVFLILFSYVSQASHQQEHDCLSDHKTLTFVTLIQSWFLPVTEELSPFFCWTNFKTPLQKRSVHCGTTVSLSFSHSAWSLLDHINPLTEKHVPH